MAPATQSPRFSLNGLISIFCLVLLVAGVPLVVKRAHDASQALSHAVGQQITLRLRAGT